MYHPQADVERQCLPRSAGGRGPTRLEMTFKTSTTGPNTYLKDTNDIMKKEAPLNFYMKMSPSPKIEETTTKFAKSESDSKKGSTKRPERKLGRKTYM